MAKDQRILILNGGSSSLKFAVYGGPNAQERKIWGKFDRIGKSNTSFRIEDNSDSRDPEDLGQVDHRAACVYLLEWLDQRLGPGAVAAVGHRIVHGGPRYSAPALVDEAMLAELRRISSFAPEHLPAEIEIISACRRRLESTPQIACFDTAFHRDMPRVARILPIPRRFHDQGVERYGFHGLSYSYVMQTLSREAGAAAGGRVVIAHLGNGASLAAILGGKSVDTTMGFTPAAGVPMSTRTGDLDPGLVLYLAKANGMDADAFDRMVNHESGLLGISETSSDVRDLLAREATDPRAAEALALFCYGVRKAIGALAAVLGGLDILVFTGGIGENAAIIRERICEGLGFLGVELDIASNTSGAPIISSGTSRTQVRVIATDEEAVIAQAVAAILTQKERRE